MIKVIKHPLLQKDLSILRNKDTAAAHFRSTALRCFLHLAIAAFQELEVVEIVVQTPFEVTEGSRLSQDVLLVPIMNSGILMTEPFLKVLPACKLGYIGLKRNKSAEECDEYYFYVPNVSIDATVVVVDYVLATGATFCSALSRLQLEGFKNFIAVALIASPEGIERIGSRFPDVPIVTAALDRQLNESDYVLPGLGDAGERFSG